MQKETQSEFKLSGKRNLHEKGDSWNNVWKDDWVILLSSL